MYGLPANIVGKSGAQPSVIELPMNTTRGSDADGAPSSNT